MNKRRPSIPLPIKTQLRQEAFFGCAKCGNPILEYHHIVPWSERQHNDPAHMIALCPNHHTELGKLSRKLCYDLKKEPFNKVEGHLNGLLGSDKSITEFQLGGVVFANTPVIIEYCRVPIISYIIKDGQTLISVFIPDQNFWPEIKIVENNLVAKMSEFWDIEFATNIVKFRKKKGKNFLTIDLRQPTAIVSGNLSVGGHEFAFNPSSTTLNNCYFEGSRIENCRVGYSIGNNDLKLITPNFAMLNPRHYFVK